MEPSANTPTPPTPPNESSAMPPAAGQVISPLPETPSMTNDPVLPEPTTAQPGPELPTNQPPAELISTPSKKQRLVFLKRPRKFVLALIIFIIAAGSSAAAYYGYYLPNQPDNIWSTALNNTGKGYDKLSSYITTPKNTKGYSLAGSFKVSGGVAADGTFTGASQNNNSQLTGSISAAGLKVNLDFRSITSNGNSPDIYFKVDGISGLGTLLGGGDPTYTNALNGLNNKWYVVDHTLFDQFAKGSNSNLQLTDQDISSGLKAFGDASKQYVFTTDSQKMAFRVKQNVGKEKTDGRNTYHYKVSVNKTNLKAYLKALCTNLKASKLNRFFDGSGQNIDQALNCQNSDTLANQFSESDTADVWVDLHTKLIHKIRFTSKTHKTDYLDVAQDYQGGDNLPFSVALHSQSGKDSTDGNLAMTLNMKTNVFSLSGDIKSSGDLNTTGNFKLTITPNSTPVKVEAPAGAKNIIELLNDLGLADAFGSPSPTTGTAKDTRRKTDINSLRSQMEVYYADNGHYPTLANVNDPAWRKTNMPGFDDAALQDPEGTSATLVGAPQAKAYAYQPLPAGCDNIHTQCNDYTLTATLESGTAYVRQSLNGPGADSTLLN